MRGYLEQAEKQASGWVVAERVARIREGFDWVMKETGFTVADLDNPSGFPSVPVDGTSATVGLAKIRFPADLAKLRYHKMYERTDGHSQGVMFGGQGIIGYDLRIETPGEYVVTVTARGTHYKDIDPEMHVYVDSHYAGHVTVGPADYKDYPFHVSIGEPGVSRVLISFWNASGQGESRALYVKEISVARERP